jgi:hypothetical protein
MGTVRGLTNSYPRLSPGGNQKCSIGGFPNGVSENRIRDLSCGGQPCRGNRQHGRIDVILLLVQDLHDIGAAGTVHRSDYVCPGSERNRRYACDAHGLAHVEGSPSSCVEESDRAYSECKRASGSYEHFSDLLVRLRCLESTTLKTPSYSGSTDGWYRQLRTTAAQGVALQGICHPLPGLGGSRSGMPDRKLRRMQSFAHQ